MQSLRLVLFGPPGAGKGTQAQLLKQQLGVPHISSGDLFRYHRQEGTPLGQRVAQYMDQGLLVPDQVTIDIVLEKVLALPKKEGFLLDGFPRNRNQAEALENALETRSRALDRVVYADVPEEELVRRLGGRFTCRRCHAPHTIADAGTAATLQCQHCGGELYQRADDAPAAVRRRIQVYRQETLPVLDFFRERGLLVEICGVGDIDAVNQRMLAALGVKQQVPKRDNPE